VRKIFSIRNRQLRASFGESGKPSKENLWCDPMGVLRLNGSNRRSFARHFEMNLRRLYPDENYFDESAAEIRQIALGIG